MPTQLPPDEVLLETTLAEKIKEIIESISVVTPSIPFPIPTEMMPKVYSRERFTDTDEEDETVTTKPDPVSEGLFRTNVIQVGIPTVTESLYAGGAESATQLDLTYPIFYELEIVDEWDNSDGKLLYANSTALFKAVYMRSRRKFKQNYDLGFANCVHQFLQQVSAVSITDEETGGKLHVADWSLTVQVTGILV